jgi:hypothetical protein
MDILPIAFAVTALYSVIGLLAFQEFIASNNERK